MSGWALTLSLAGLLGLAQLLLWAAARGLGRRLEGRAMAAGLALPFLLLLPWLGGEPLLVPIDALRLQIPGAPPVDDPDPHDLLNDAVFQFIPWELEVRHALSAGRLPLWSDRLGGGSSPWINPQAGALSPIAMLTRPLHIQYFLLAALALKVLVAFHGAWLLARVLGAGRRAALVAGASFALGGGILAWGLFPHTRAAAWVPWVAAGAVAVVRRPTALKVATTAALTAAMLLAGHPETALAGGLFAALLGVGLRRRPGRRTAGSRGRTAAFRGVGSAAAAALLGFGLAAPQLVPFLAAVGGTHRAAVAAEHRLPAVAFDLTEPETWFREGRGRHLLAPVHRHAFGRPYFERFRGAVSWPDASAAYAGVLAFAGTLAAGAAVRRRRVLAPLLLFAAGSLVLASQPLPLMRLLHRVPALRVPSYDRLLLVTALALAVAGALGLESLTRRRRGWGGWAGLAAATAAGVALAPGTHVALLWAGVWGAVLLWRRERRLLRLARSAGREARAITPGPGAPPGGVPRPRRARWLGVLGRFGRGRRQARPAAGSPSGRAVPRDGAPDLASARRGRRLAGLGASALLAGVLLSDLLPWARDHLPVGRPGLFYPPSAVTEAMRAEVAEGGPWRVVGEEYLVYPGILSVYGLDDPRPHDPMAPMDQMRVLGAAFDFAPTLVRYFAPFRDPEQPLLDFLNVRVVYSNPYLPRHPTFERFDPPEVGANHLWRNPDALPRWFLASGADVIERHELPDWIARLEDPRRVALWAEEAGDWRPEEPMGPGGGAASPGGRGSREPSGVVLEATTPGRVLLRLPPAAGSGERLLATSLPSPEGWRATAGDGRSLRRLTVNGAFLGAAVPAEVGTVRLAFTPRGFRLGWGLFAPAAVAIAVLLARRVRRATAARPSRPAPGRA